jgi:4-carboxymuconolactone decarboxylase
MMDKERFERGLAKRRAVLGSAHVDKSLAQADEFSRPFQELVTEYCWGFAWGDDRLGPKTRSVLNLAMIAALNRAHEWELHLKGAIRNGVTKEEIQAILHQVAIYCGIPAGVECFRIARRVFAEMDESDE